MCSGRDSMDTADQCRLELTLGGHLSLCLLSKCTRVLGAKPTLAPLRGRGTCGAALPAATGGDRIPSREQSTARPKQSPQTPKCTPGTTLYTTAYQQPPASDWESLTAPKHLFMYGLLIYQYHMPAGYGKSPPDQGDATTYLPKDF